MYASDFLCVLFPYLQPIPSTPWLRRLGHRRSAALLCLFWLLLALPAGARTSVSPWTKIAAWLDVLPVTRGVPQHTTETKLAVAVGSTPVTSVASGTAVTLSAAVTNGGNLVTTGQVEFCDASSFHCQDIHLLGTVQLTSAGTASLKIVPGIGSHSFQAVFRASGSNAASTSSRVDLTVTGKYPINTTTVTEGSSGDDGHALTVPGGISWLNYQTPAFLNSPQFITTGDFNGDGIPDLAVASTDGKTAGGVTVLLGVGDGSFKTASSLTTGGSPQAIAVGDFNGDDIPDIAVATSGSATSDADTVTVFLGNGDGTFTATDQVLNTGFNPAAITVGDFNGDGTADLAVANAGSNTVTVLLGDGKGRFTTAASPGTGDFPSSIATGDFNGDGVLDLAVANSYSNTLTILLGNGDGSFTPSAASPATGQSPRAVVAGDFNGDGIPDLAVVNDATGTLTILLGKGDGTFTATSVSPATVSNPTALVVGDFNGDGIADLAVVNGDSATLPYHLTILLGNGDGTFTAPAVNPPTGYQPSSVAAADFNGDGHSDLAVANHGDGTVSILLTQWEQTASTSSAVASPEAATCPGPQSMNIIYYTIAETDKDANRLTTGLSSNYVLLPLGANGLPVYNPAATVNGGPATSPDDLLGDNEITWWSPALNNGGPNGISDVVQTGTGVVTLPFTNNAFYPPNGSGSNDRNGFQAAVLSANLSIPATQTISFTISSDDMAFLYLDGVVACNDGGVHAATSVPCTSSTLPVGSHTLQLFFVDLNPVDAVLDFTVTTSGVCTAPITQLTPTISWSTPAAITYGTQLSPTQLDASSNVAGSFSYSPASGAILPAGQQTLTATFTPTDTTNYTNATATVSLTVSKATPAITWATPAAITYGTALSATQLDASSNIAGSFSYSPPSGAILSAGQQTLTAAFTPADSADYTTASAGTQLIVQPAPVTLLLASSTNSVPAGTPFTLTATTKSGTAQMPTGTVTFWNGASSLGTASLANGVATYSTALFSIGGTALTANYSGDANFVPATSNPIPVAVQAAATTNLLTASPNPAPFGTSVSFTSTLISLDGTPTGSVTFYDGGTALGVASLISGVATYSTSTLAVGPHNITSILAGTPSFAASTSNMVVETVADFTISAAPASGTLYTGESASFTVSISSVTGFNLPVSLSCSGLAAYTTCSFSPQILIGSGVSTVVVQTTAPSQMAHRSEPFAALRVTALAGLLLLFIPRRGRRAGKNGMAILIFFALIAMGVATTGCSGNRSLVDGTPVGAQTITVIGTVTSGAQTLSHQTTMTLNVKSLF